MVGGAIPAPRLLRHPKATLSGTTAHVVVGGLAAWGMGQAVGAIGHGAAWVDPGPVPGALAAFLAAGAAAAVDLLLRLPDDNLPGAAAAGFVLRAARGLL